MTATDMKKNDLITEMVNACIEEMHMAATPAKQARTAMQWMKKANAAGISTDDFIEGFNSHPDVEQTPEAPKDDIYLIKDGGATFNEQLETVTYDWSSKKATSWKPIVTYQNIITKEIEIALNRLKVHQIPDHIDNPQCIFTNTKYQFYLIEYRKELYLIDTQGYEYARYITRLPDSYKR